MSIDGPKNHEIAARADEATGRAARQGLLSNMTSAKPRVSAIIYDVCAEFWRKEQARAEGYKEQLLELAHMLLTPIPQLKTVIAELNQHYVNLEKENADLRAGSKQREIVEATRYRVFEKIGAGLQSQIDDITHMAEEIKSSANSLTTNAALRTTTLIETIEELLAQPSACTSDAEVTANNAVRDRARRVVEAMRGDVSATVQPDEHA